LILFPDVHCGSCGDAKVDLIAGCCGWAGIYWLSGRKKEVGEKRQEIEEVGSMHEENTTLVEV